MGRGVDESVDAFENPEPCRPSSSLGSTRADLTLLQLASIPRSPPPADLLVSLVRGDVVLVFLRIVPSGVLGRGLSSRSNADCGDARVVVPSPLWGFAAVGRVGRK